MRAVFVCAASLLCCALIACSTKPIPAGGKCNVSEQCAAGLLCDTTQKPAICAGQLANPPPDLAGTKSTDLASSDLSAQPTTDMAAMQLDMAAAADLSHKD